MAKANRIALEAVCDNLVKTIDSLPGHCRIHAEMQLILFYASKRAPRHLPRVITASKSACFLCYSFVKLYGELYLPHTHGKLYAKWTLPNFASLDITPSMTRMLEGAMAELNSVIEIEI